MEKTHNTCFHCNRNLSQYSTDKEEMGCNYCSILLKFLEETGVEEEVIDNTSKIDFTNVMIILFVLLFIALAIILYNWSQQTISFALDVNNIFFSVFYLYSYKSITHSIGRQRTTRIKKMESFSVKMTTMGYS